MWIGRKFVTENKNEYKVVSEPFIGRYGHACVSCICNNKFVTVDCNTLLSSKFIELTEDPLDSISIKIKYFTDKIDKLAYVDGKSDWIDLRAAESVDLKQGSFKLIPLGIAMELPMGYEAHLVPRSSTFKNYGIIQTNHMGVIDCSYCGDNDQWMMPVYATRDTHIECNDRICQFRIVENQPKLSFNEVAILNGKNRGGFGSTGKQ